MVQKLIWAKIERTLQCHLCWLFWVSTHRQKWSPNTFTSQFCSNLLQLCGQLFEREVMAIAKPISYEVLEVHDFSVTFFRFNAVFSILLPMLPSLLLLKCALPSWYYRILYRFRLWPQSIADCLYWWSPAFVTPQSWLSSFVQSFWSSWPNLSQFLNNLPQVHLRATFSTLLRATITRVEPTLQPQDPAKSYFARW